MSHPNEAVDVVDESALRQVLHELDGVAELAVDVEADAMHAFRARLCWVQLGTDARVYLIDTLAPGVRAELLARHFGDPGRTKYFHAAGGDLQYLAEAGVRVKGLFDTHRAATFLGWPKVGLLDLVLERCGVTLAKEHQQSDFSLRPLPPEVHRYISDDVRYLCDVGRWVREACQKLDILEEVELDCAKMADEAGVRPDAAQVLPKIPRTPGVKPELALEVAKKLHARRLFWAEQANLPMGRMLSNAALVAVSTRLPSTVKELSRLEGVRSAFAREHGEEVLELIRVAVQALRDGALVSEPKDAAPKDPKRRKREEALRAFRAEKAAARKVTGSVVLTNAHLSVLSESPALSVEDLAQVPYFGEKRLRLYGEELLRLLSSV